MSTSRKPAWSGPSKKISSWVRPGVCEVRASALRPVSALIRLDLPTLERPANATSMPAIGGSVSIEGEAQKNCQSPANSFRPRSISSASVSTVMRRLSIHHPRHCEEQSDEAIQSLGPSTGLLRFARNDGSESAVFWTRLRHLLRSECGPEIVEHFNLHAIAAHDEALRTHRKQVVQ